MRRGPVYLVKSTHRFQAVIDTIAIFIVLMEQRVTMLEVTCKLKEVTR